MTPCGLGVVAYLVIMPGVSAPPGRMSGAVVVEAAKTSRSRERPSVLYATKSEARDLRLHPTLERKHEQQA